MTVSFSAKIGNCPSDTNLYFESNDNTVTFISYSKAVGLSPFVQYYSK